MPGKVDQYLLIMNASTKPVGSEEIHLWPAFLFNVSGSAMDNFKHDWKKTKEEFNDLEQALVE